MPRDPRPKLPAGSRGSHLRLGRSGEDRAVRWYTERGYELLARNWRCPRGELDLVLRSGDTIVFCEVKTRSSERFGSPFEAVDRRRRQRLRAAATAYLASEGLSARGLRFDVVGILPGSVEVREGAF